MSSEHASCPRCRLPLESVATPIGQRQFCPSCKGEAIAAGVVARVSTDGTAQLLLGASVDESRFRSTHRFCPWCAQMMQAVDGPSNTKRAEGPEVNLEIDVCSACQLFWFDPDELAALPTNPTVAAELARPGGIRCESCGAPARPDLDARCEYCHHWLAPASMPKLAVPIEN